MMVVARGVKFAIVLHGPEAVDTGLAERVINLLSKENRIEAVMSGHTGIAAIIDAELEDQVDISGMRKPSQELARLSPSNDVLLLVNCAKSRESALRFGGMVHSRCKGEVDKPLIQIDDGIIIDWNRKDPNLVQRLANELGLEILSGGEESKEAETDGDRRRIHGIVPGEHIWIDGVVVGRIISPEVTLHRGEDGKLEAEGVELKQTGVDRLGDFDLANAHVRSGSTRRTKANARSIDSKKAGVFFIDHSAEDAIHRCQGASLVVTVGDDTSKIAGSLLYRFNVPIVAITDGDEDGISSEALKAKGSVVIRVKPGTDDVVGREVRQIIFHGQDRIDGDLSPEVMAEEVMRIAGRKLIWHSN